MELNAELIILVALVSLLAVAIWHCCYYLDVGHHITDGFTRAKTPERHHRIDVHEHYNRWL